MDTPPKLTRAEAGRLGGRATRDKHGAAYLAALGAVGGKALAAEQGPAYYAEIGRKGRAKQLARDGCGKFQEADDGSWCYEEGATEGQLVIP